jgi:hypothetical protein
MIFAPKYPAARQSVKPRRRSGNSAATNRKLQQPASNADPRMTALIHCLVRLDVGGYSLQLGAD